MSKYGTNNVVPKRKEINLRHSCLSFHICFTVVKNVFSPKTNVMKQNRVNNVINNLKIESLY